MSGLMKKHPTDHQKTYLYITYQGNSYQLPLVVAKRYKVSHETVSPDAVFAAINQKYTKPGALLRGLRIREGLTQMKMAKYIGVTQSDISQMENGTRRIGRIVAKRIAKRFDVNYRVFLA